MSEQIVKRSSGTGGRRRRDAGFTLPELLVSIIVLGSIVAVLSSAIVVTFQQQDNSEGRLNVSRAEQNVSMWIPADLASSGAVPSTDPKASPCSVSVFDTTGCPSNVVLTGSNALLLSWTDSVLNTSGVLEVTTTNVSYHFTPTSDGLFDLIRIECKSTDGGAWACETNAVLHDLPGPPPPVIFEPGKTKPDWVLQVSAPLPPEAVDPGDPTVTYVNNKNANRVVVTINGGGDASGRGGGINQISITAGGTTRNTIAVPSMANAPTFTQTQSRCGGPITLVVDESNSVGGDISYVKEAVTKFIQTLAGTPVQVQIVRFQTQASILGDDAAWTKYYDMTDDDDVTALLQKVPDLKGTWSPGGGTNWEDAIFRTFYAPDNAGAAPLPITPRTVVFFTDGVPTWDRIAKRGSPGVLTTQPALPAGGWLTSNGSTYSQVAFNRANYWANIWRAADDTKLIGVGVGDDIDKSSKWMANPRAGWRVGWQEQPNFTWQSNWAYATNWKYEQNGPTWEQSTFTYQARYEVKDSFWGSYYYVNKAIYDTYASNRRRDDGFDTANLTQYTTYNTTNDDTDGVRRVSTGTGWTFITQAVYNANNTSGGSGDGFRTGTGWTVISKAAYDAGNTPAGDHTNTADNFRRTSSGSTWSAVTLAEYDYGNAPAGDHTATVDGFRRTTTGTTWSNITKAEYDSHNTDSAEADGFRRINPSGTWAKITEAEYNARNTTSNEADGVRIGGQDYSEPYTNYDPEIWAYVPNKVILAKFIAGNDIGIPWSGVLNDNETEANMFIEEDWTKVPDALVAVALGECGATLTLQTKVGAAYAVDPFVYQSSIGLTTVTTNLSATARTFDYDLSDGLSRTVVITPANLSDLTRYTAGTWTCKAGNVARAVTNTPMPDKPTFNSMSVVVGANEAVSCIHSVTAS